MVRNALTILMADSYPIDGKPKDKTEKMHPEIWKRYAIFFAVIAMALAVVIGYFAFATQAPVKSETGPPSGDAVNPVVVATGTATPGQETTNTAGIAVSVARVNFFQAEQWKLNTLYIDPENPGKGTLLVRMKDIEYLQPFRIANAEYSNFRLEKHKKDIFGVIAELKANAVTSQGNVGALLWIQVWDKLPQKGQDGIMNRATVLDSTSGGFVNLPPINSVLLIEITQA